MIDEESANRVKENLYLGAWIGWQLGAGEKKTWGAYYKSLGLESDTPMSPELIKLMAEKAKEKAARIVELAQRKKK